MFNFSTAFDKYFHKVITEFEDSFNAAVIREKQTVDPDTRAVRNERVTTAFVKMNWVNPEHKQEITFNGRVYVTDVLFLIEPTVDLIPGDTVINLDKNTAFDIVGIKDFVSHREAQAAFKETGLSGSLDEVRGFYSANSVFVNEP